MDAVLRARMRASMTERAAERTDELVGAWMDRYIAFMTLLSKFPRLYFLHTLHCPVKQTVLKQVDDGSGFPSGVIR